MKNLLVVIDMVNGFVNFGALADKNIGKVTPTIIKMIDDAKKNDFKVLAFKDCHNKDDEEFKVFPPHCLKGTSESELVPELKKLENKFDYIIGKNTTNGFITNEFKELLKSNKYDNVVVCGCCTDICVINFVESYMQYIKKENLDTNIYVIKNTCYTFDGPSHNAEDCHNNALKQMEKMGAAVVKYPSKECEKIL